MALHESVLLEEALQFLGLEPGQTVVDGTLGAGGHAKAILERLGAKGRLIGIDKDPWALEEAKKVLKSFGDAAMLVHGDFGNISRLLEEQRVASVDAMLLDLGVSSMQLDSADRGFSFQQDGPLDMRMNPQSKLTAQDVINRYSEEKLRDILWTFGEERFGRRIAKKIIETRPLRTTGELAAIVSAAVPGSYRHGRLHPATRTFQAIRMEVNSELAALQNFLKDATKFLRSGGRLVVISFHSLEDRLVKHAFKSLAAAREGSVLTKKPVRPTESEMERNARSRSAKLRAFEKA